MMRLTRLAIATAPAIFVVLWSTGFIGARYGLPYIEPLTFLAVRMGFVVLIMGAIAVIGRAKVPTTREVGHALVAGSLVHGLYLGGVFTAISQGVPAGVSALIPGLQPILTSTIANRFMGETVTRVQWIGLALGLAGVVLVLHDRSIVLAGSVLGWVAPFLSLVGTTLGDPLSETILRRDQTGARGILCNMSAQAFCLRSVRSHLRRARSTGPVSWSSRLPGWCSGPVDCRDRADVLVDPTLGGDRLCKPVLSGARVTALFAYVLLRKVDGIDRRHGDLRGWGGAGQ